MEILDGGLYNAQAEIYNGLTGSYAPSELLSEFDGDAEEAAKSVVDGAISAGMISTADIGWRDGGITYETDCYTLIQGYLERHNAD